MQWLNFEEKFNMKLCTLFSGRLKYGIIFCTVPYSSVGLIYSLQKACFVKTKSYSKFQARFQWDTGIMLGE